MILDSLPFHATYSPGNPRLAAAFEYLRCFDRSIAAGRYSILGDEVFALVQDYRTTPAVEKKYESHRLYIDLQYLVSGTETIYWQPLANLRVTDPYVEEKDVQLYAGEDDRPIHLLPDDFVILFPHDGHKPGCIRAESQGVRKVVVKVRV